MNRIEKLVYDAVKHNPHIKGKIRNLYQSAYDLLPSKKDFSVHPILAKEGYFFGFHDISPFSVDDTKVLANKLTIPLRMPQKGDVLEVGYFELNKDQFGNFIKIGESRAWNYHKGCRLQWVGSEKIIYNDVVENQLVSKVFSLKDGTTETIPFPIDTVSPCGKFATSFSYGRLEMTMPGYGYPYDDGSFKDIKVTKETGLFIGNLLNGAIELVADLEQLHQKGGLSQYPIEDAHQYVTHSLFSPDGRYVSFLYRATVVEFVSKRWTQMGVFDRETNQLYFSPTDDMVSHYVWNEKNQIIAYSRLEGQDSHVLFKEPTLQSYERIAYPQLNSDGHQSFISDEAFVTDTYPDKHRMAKLYKVDIKSNEATLLASVNSFKKFQSKPYKHWCCDLHPRMNRKGDMVCFDSVHTGQRALCIMKI